MTDLERCAMLGDREAQEECTRQGILLPCPFCGEKPFVKTQELDGYTIKTISCCITVEKLVTPLVDWALKAWNTRVAPPIRRCDTCKWAGENIEHPSDPHIFCDQFERILLKDDFCSLYEPEEGNHGQ